MKKTMALLLICALLFSLVSVHAEKAGKYDRLTVGVTTPFSGNFLDDTLGSNISDQDVRRLIHGYNLVVWSADKGAYEINQPIVTGGTSSENGRTFTFSINNELTYNNGIPITAKDYAFTLLLLGSAELREATGTQGRNSRILGGNNYQEGKTKVLAGFRLISDSQFKITIDPAYETYFYELKVLEISPLPISVIAPGCSIKDDGKGVYISGPFSAELLKKTLLDPETGYISHPSVTCGPYQLASYDGDSVTLDLNKAFLGDSEGKQPTIPQIVIRVADSQNLIGDLNAGRLDLAVRCARADQIQNGMALVGQGFAMKSYLRAGTSFISFCAEKGLTADLNVRKAAAMCMDKEQLTREYNGGFGMTVNGYYGIGQWMFRMVNGMIQQEEDDESDWSDLDISRLSGYPLDVETAGKLLDEAGWNLNEKGSAYSAAAGGIRYKQTGDGLLPLKLKLIYPKENGTGTLLQDTFISNLSKAGIRLETEALPWEEVLKRFYRQTEPECDMILIGTNLGDVFDPSDEYDQNGTSLRNGITDPKLSELAIAMRSTEPGAAVDYCRRWLDYQEERSAVAAEIPLYSDAYLDFHISELQDYEPAPTGSWTMAVQNAFLSDYAPKEEADDLE